MRGLMIVFLAGVLLTSGTSVEAQYFYGPEGPVPLVIDSTKVLIQFAPAVTPYMQDQMILSIDRITTTIPSDNAFDRFIACSLSTNTGYGSFLDSLEAIEGISLVEPYYKTRHGNPCPPGMTFYAAFDTLVGEGVIDSLNAAFGVDVVRTLSGIPNVYVLHNTPATGLRILDLANAYHNLDATLFAHPAFGVRPELFNYRLYDYYAQYQSHLKKVIGDFNNVSVWDFAGLDSAITVAVIDDGIAEHEDLPETRIVGGYDFIDPPSTLIPGQLMAHGMGCAGIIAASHSIDSASGAQPMSGVISLNPKVKIMPIRIFNDVGWGPMDQDVIANAITFAYMNGADVLSCSWGYKDPDFDWPLIRYAIQSAYTWGRNGLGCLVIFAAGNSAVSWPDTVAFPARDPHCLAVGAVDLQDNRWYYSQYGPELDLVAPSDSLDLHGNVWSLDQMGQDGFNPNLIYGGRIIWNCPTIEENNVDYDCHFGGTSAACPVVSGVASLLLAKRPNLRVEIIYDILRNSAVRDLESGTITSPDTAYGYGRVDAFRAVLAISRGDANNDDRITSGDAVAIINHIFGDGSAPRPVPAIADANCDGLINSGDAVYIINYIFRSGPPPLICYHYDY